VGVFSADRYSVGCPFIGTRPTIVLGFTCVCMPPSCTEECVCVTFFPLVTGASTSSCVVQLQVGSSNAADPAGILCQCSQPACTSAGNFTPSQVHAVVKPRAFGSASHNMPEVGTGQTGWPHYTVVGLTLSLVDALSRVFRLNNVFEVLSDLENMHDHGMCIGCVVLSMQVHVHMHMW